MLTVHEYECCVVFFVANVLFAISIFEVYASSLYNNDIDECQKIERNLTCNCFINFLFMIIIHLANCSAMSMKEHTGGSCTMLLFILSIPVRIWTLVIYHNFSDNCKEKYQNEYSQLWVAFIIEMVIAYLIICILGFIILISISCCIINNYHMCCKCCKSSSNAISSSNHVENNNNNASNIIVETNAVPVIIVESNNIQCQNDIETSANAISLAAIKV